MGLSSDGSDQTPSENILREMGRRVEMEREGGREGGRGKDGEMERERKLSPVIP